MASHFPSPTVERTPSRGLKALATWTVEVEGRPYHEEVSTLLFVYDDATDIEALTVEQARIYDSPLIDRTYATPLALMPQEGKASRVLMLDSYRGEGGVVHRFLEALAEDPLLTRSEGFLLRDLARRFA